MNENVIGFSILITGTDSGVKQLGETKRALLDNEAAIKKLTEATKGNVGAQKASAVQMAALQAQQKALKQEYNAQEKAIINNAQATQHAAGSYNALTSENANLSAQLRALPIDNTNEEFKKLTKQLLANTNELKTFDEAIGRHHRNVGNYPNTISILGKGIKGLTGLSGELSSALGVHGEALNVIVIVGKAAAKTAKDLSNAKKLQKLATDEATVATEVESIAHTETTTAVEAETIAQKALNLVKGGGIGIVIAIGAALVAAAAAIYAYVAASKKAEEIEKIKATAIDGTIIKNKELRDSYNESVVSQEKIITSWKLFRGEITEVEAGMQNLASENRIAIQDIVNETSVAAKEVTASWLSIFMGAANAQTSINEQQLELFKEADKKIKAFSVKAEAAAKEARNKAQQDKITEYRQQTAESIEASKRYREEIANADEQANKKAEAKRKENQDKIDAEIKANTQRILQLTAQLAKGQVDLMAEGIEKEKAAIDNKYAELIKAEERGQVAIISTNKKLAEQQLEINRLSNARIVQLKEQNTKEIIKINETDGKKQFDLKLKALDLEQQIEIEGVNQSEDTERKKAEDILAIQKKFAQDKIDLLEASAAAETLETKAQIAKLKTVIETDLKPEPGKSPLEMAFGTDSETAKVAIDSAIALAGQISDMIFEAQNAKNKRLLDQNLEKLENEKDTELRVLQNKLEQGAITETQFRLEKELLDTQFRNKELEEKKKAFEKEKELKRKQILIELALELIKIAAAYASIPYVGWATAVVQGAAAVAAAGVQIAAIDAQTFESGGVLNGPSHDKGGIPFTVNGQSGFEAEGGESIINKRSTAMYRPILSRINEAGGGRSFAMGGIPLPAIDSPQQMRFEFNSDEFIDKLSGSLAKRVNDKKVKLLESDVSDAQNRARVLDSESSF